LGEPTITVILADDDGLVREAFKSLVSTFSGIKVVGEAETGQQAVQLCKELHPDVVLMDVNMPVMGGLTATVEIRRLCPEVRVLAVSVLGSGTAVRAMLRAGASGYVTKKAKAAVLHRAIWRTAAGDKYLDPGLSSVVVEQLLMSESSARSKGVLSGRELEVLHLIAHGFGNQEIADKLQISVKTVESYRAHLAEKLGLRTRSQIVQYALDHGLLR
jgi:DNA-binding NarL/FixJ family response regulator